MNRLLQIDKPPSIQNILWIESPFDFAHQRQRRIRCPPHALMRHLLPPTDSRALPHGRDGPPPPAAVCQPAPAKAFSREFGHLMITSPVPGMGLNRTFCGSTPWRRVDHRRRPARNHAGLQHQRRLARRWKLDQPLPQRGPFADDSGPRTPSSCHSAVSCRTMYSTSGPVPSRPTTRYSRTGDACIQVLSTPERPCQAGPARSSIATGVAFDVTSAARSRSAIAASGTAQANRRRLLRNRLQPQRHLRDDAQRPKRSREQLAKVVARHIFDNPPAAFERRPRPSTA